MLTTLSKVEGKFRRTQAGLSFYVAQERESIDVAQEREPVERSVERPPSRE